MITLITMAQGNPIALKRTLDSLKGYVNEVIFGDVLVFGDDRRQIKSYADDYNMKIVQLPFNFIFKFGFANILNELASHASNDFCLYMNCGEVIDPSFPKPKVPAVNEAGFNCYFFTHATDRHQWIRLYNRKELKWDGLIHEEVKGARKRCPVPIFVMADTPKDDSNVFKSNVYNDIKEMCYFHQYLRLVEEPDVRGITNIGWVQWAQDSYKSFKERLQTRGQRYQAFVDGDLGMYIDGVMNSEIFNKDDVIEFGARRFKDTKLQ